MKKREKGEINLPKKLPILSTLKICKFLPILTNAAYEGLEVFKSFRHVFYDVIITNEGNQLNKT